MKKQHYILISLIWLCIAVVFAIILRSSFMFGMGSWFNYKYFLHTHSHIAFLGWIFNIIYYFLLKQYELLELKKYGILYVLLNISVLGMLLTYPFQGYAALSILFTTLHILFSYIFAFFFVKDTKGKKSIHRKFALAGIFFMTISSVGPFMLGPIISMGLKETIWYDLAIYFYLHFQYNGWFLMSLISIIVFKIKVIDTDNWNRAFNLFFVSTILNLSLSTLWTNPGWVINILSVLSSMMQFHALFLMSKDLHNYFKTVDRFQSYIYKLIFLLITLKVFFALTGSIQEVAYFVYYNRNLVIGFLHLVFLGIITPFFFQQIANEVGIEKKEKYKQLMVVFMLLFFVSEVLYMLTALGFKGETTLLLLQMIVYTTWLLAAATISLAGYFIYSKYKPTLSSELKH